MKKIFSFIVLFGLILSLSINAFAIVKWHSRDFKEGTTLFSMGETSFEIPSAWDESDTDDEDFLSFDFENGMFFVQRVECNGDILEQENKTEYIETVKNIDGYENMTDFMSYNLPLIGCGKQALSYTCSCTISGIDIDLYSSAASFEDNTHLVVFSLYDYADSDCDHSNDYYSILDSITIVDAEIESEENGKTGSEGELKIQTEHIETLGEQNALSRAESYLNSMAFSYSGLIKQLEFEGFTTDEATYAADNCGADWNEQAAKKAEEYLNHSAFSKDGLKEQLEFEGFTAAQAGYAVEAVGY